MSATLTPVQVEALNERFRQAPTEEVLRWAWDQFGSSAAIGTSFQGAGLVMMHLAQRSSLPFPVFTLDTGLLFPETVALKARLEAFFGYPIEALLPDQTVAQQEAVHGPALWSRDPDLCCTLRKVVPLQSKLATLRCWITGLRRQQSDTRSDTGVVELYSDPSAPEREIVKLNPMAYWTREAVWKYLHEHAIPYNPLHDRGYQSIGCQPCTQATGSGDPERAGRWTGFGKRECGIHTFMPRKV
jgi:phosphoadenosine phosphosulfate reductase